MKSSLATALLVAAAFASPAFACGETKSPQCQGIVVEHAGQKFCLGEAVSEDEHDGVVVINMGNNDYVVRTQESDGWYTGHAKYRCLDSPLLLQPVATTN